MAIPPLFKGPLQSLCRTHCALTTIALVCALVLGSSFPWLLRSQLLSVPLCLHASLPRSTSAQAGTQKHAPHHDCLNLSLLLSLYYPTITILKPSVLLPSPHYSKEGKQPFSVLFIVRFRSEKKKMLLLFSYSCIQSKVPYLNEIILKVDFACAMYRKTFGAFLYLCEVSDISKRICIK